MRRNLVAIALLQIVLFSSAAQIQGYTYDFYTLELLNNTIVQINTQPMQQIVAKNGIYSFTISPGTYELEAGFYRNTEIILYTIENVSIADDGIFELDLLLEPVENSTYSIEIPEFPEEEGNGGQDIVLILVGVGSVLFLIYYNHKRHVGLLDVKAKGEKLEVPKEAEKEIKEVEIELPKITITAGEKKVSEEAERVLDIIRKSEGRIQQKELRKIFKFSEAKMSNLLDELEEAGKIRRIKKGRGNLIRQI
ncbi:MAG: hypothetical protein V1835_00030 [Candidatus Micrarchaeota archaeon]